jgi:hypothetical protein
MSTDRVKHFLIIYDIPRGIADVMPYGTDYASALQAYAQAEERWRDDEKFEVVLLGSDSLETLKRTHSSYFELSERHADQVVGRELAELGLR